VKVVGSANGLQGSSVASSDVRDKLEFVAQLYDRDKTLIINNVDGFRRNCVSYKVNMYTSLFAPNDDF